MGSYQTPEQTGTHDNPQVVSFVKASICIKDNSLRLKASQNVNKPGAGRVPERVLCVMRTLARYHECKASVTTSHCVTVLCNQPFVPDCCYPRYFPSYILLSQPHCTRNLQEFTRHVGNEWRE